MKLIAALIICTFAFVSEAKALGTLTTENYVVTISQNCEEGNVTCENVTYHGVSKKTGKAITLKGTTSHSMCPDGKTPCRFMGYEFKNGNIKYVVLEAGLLQVIKGNNTLLLEEEGQWQWR